MQKHTYRYSHFHLFPLIKSFLIQYQHPFTTIMSKCPPQILGSEGQRIKLIFGSSGNSYLLILDEDDGDQRWQNYYCNNIPAALANQLEIIQKQDRFMRGVSFGTKGRWFVRGKRRDGSGSHIWWGGCQNNLISAIKKNSGEGNRLQVSFGQREDQAILKIGKNGYAQIGYTVNRGLTDRMARINNAKKNIARVRLFPFYSSSSWFISDDEGQEWYISKHYSINQELNKGNNVHDVALAGDGSWCVIRENKATFSTGVAKEVENQINNFFSRQRHRRQKRDIEIQHYKEEQIRKAKRLEREEAEMKRKNKLEEAAREHKRRRIALISRLKVGTRVTVFGYSRNYGDARVTAQYTGEEKNSISVIYDDHNTYSEVDPRKVEIFDSLTKEVATEGKLQDMLSEKEKLRKSERECLIANHALKYKMFLWRGLREDETGIGLFAKNPIAEFTASDTVINGRLESQYIHLTKNPEVAIYFSAAFSPYIRPFRIAQVDMSKINIEDVHDLSDGKNLTTQAANFAKSHEVVLVREHIPAKAITIRTISSKLSIPTGVRGSFVDYQGMLRDSGISEIVRKWRYKLLENILKREVDYIGICHGPYPSHCLLLARLISESADRRCISQLCKDIVGYGSPIQRYPVN